MSAPGKSRTALLLLLIVAAAGILRTLYLVNYSSEPEFIVPSVDGAYHDYWARGLAFDDWRAPQGFANPGIHDRAYFRPPAYPYLLAGIYRVFGGGYLYPRLFQSFLGLLTVLAAFYFARRRFGEITALIYASLMAFYWIFIYYEGELLGTGPTIFLIVLLFAVTARWGEKGTVRTALIAGICLGVTSLFRPNLLLFLPAGAVWFWRYRPRRLPARKIIFHLLIYILGVMVPIIPVTLRNYRVEGEPVPISSQGGMSLMIGNNLRANGSNHYLPGFGVIQSPFDYPAAVRTLAKERGIKGDAVSYGEASRIYSEKALEYVIHNPLHFLRLTLRKALLFWGPAEVTNNREIAAVRDRSPVLKSLPMNFGFAAGLFLSGVAMLLARRRRGEITIFADRTALSFQTSVLVLVFIATYFLSVLPFAAAARYRVPVIGGLLLFAARVLHSLGRMIGKRRYRQLAVWIPVTGVCFLITRLNPAGYESSPAKWYYDRGRVRRETGDLPLAAAAYRRALEIKPDYIRARNNLGEVLLENGDPRGAEEEFRRALRLDPVSAEVTGNLGEALFRQGRDKAAEEYFRRALNLDPESFRTYNNLGVLLHARGNYPSAERNLRKALSIRPGYARARYNLGLVLQEQNKNTEAVKQYRRAAAIDPLDPRPWNNLGNIFLSRGEIDQAYRQYRRALELDPGLTAARVNRANILAGWRRFTEAVGEYHQALSSDPKNASAQYNLAYTLELMEEPGLARHYYQASLKADPDNPRIYYRLALLALKEGERPAAVDYLRRSLDIQPDFRPAVRKLEELAATN